ncbi:MAG: flagellar motor switch protein FliG [Gemmatimonadota bacterium]
MTAIASRTQPKDLSGVTKTAILFIALGQAEAARMMQDLSPVEIEQVMREIARLGSVRPEIIQAVMDEFHQASQTVGQEMSGGVEYANQVVTRAFGAAASAPYIEQTRGNTGSNGDGFKRLKRAAPEALAEILRSEHPQTVALILAHMENRQAIQVIETMSTELATDILYRMAGMGKVAPDVLALVEHALGSRADLNLTQQMTAPGGPAAVAKVINMAGKEKEKALLENMETRNPELARQVRALMFTFEDLTLVDGKGIQRLLRDVSLKDLALALKVASDEVKAHIRSNMSERAAGALDEETDLLGPVRVKDVEAIHARIIETVRSLDEAGEIILRSRDGNDGII